MIERIVSGGQTGVDRAALDAALHSNICYGGWCPKGRIDERGLIPVKYGELLEVIGEFSTDKENYDTRTKANIRDSDGTLIIIPCLPIPTNIQDGTLLTIKEAQEREKPFLLIGLDDTIENNFDKFSIWMNENHIATLNVAGPRESSCHGVYEQAFVFLIHVIPLLQSSPTLSM